MEREDNQGLWWQVMPKPVRESAAKAPKEKRERTKRVAEINFDHIPSPPDTGWQLPTEFPSLERAEVICLDCETKDPGLAAGRGPGVRIGGKLLGVSIATDYGFNKYYPIAHKPGPNLDKETVLNWLRKELSRERQIKLGANILYDLDYLAEEGVWVKGRCEDIQIAEPLLDENAISYSLDTLAKKHCGSGKLNNLLSDWGDKFFGKGKTKNYMELLPSYFVGPYAEEDTRLTLETWRAQRPLLEKENLLPIYDIECRLIPMLLYMRRVGVRVALSKAEELAESLDREAREGLDKLTRETGRAIDIWSGDSMSTLFRHYDIPIQKTADGKESFTKGYMENLEHPMVKLVVRLRKLEKLNGTFIKGHILGNVVGDKIHCSFNQLRRTSETDLDGTVTKAAGAVSGRFSSDNPNLQNIPIRDPDFGKVIRSLFIPLEDDLLWWKADYSQIEPRVLLHYAVGNAAQTVRDMLWANPEWSPYKAIAKDMPPGIEYKTIKNIYLGLTYNMGIYKLAASLGLSVEEAQKLFNLFHEGAPYVGDLKDRVIKKVDLDGFLITLLGRRRHFDRWETRDFKQAKKDGDFTREEALAKYGPRIRRAWTFKSLNALIQGSAADVQKKAMVDLWESGIAEETMVGLTVHDELDGSISKDKLHLLDEVKSIMQKAVTLRVPVISDMSYGNSWGECD